MSPPDLPLYPYQSEAVEFARDKDRVLIADEMGLGKTPTAIGIMNENDYTNTLIICPATLKFNWENELSLWLYNTELSVGVTSSSSLPKTDIVIVNYDIIWKPNIATQLRSRKWDCIILDEGHYIKSDTANRTRGILGFRELTPLSADKIVVLSGTPMTNKTKDLWTLCRLLDPNTFSNKWAFLQRYCNPRVVFTKRGKIRTFDGASNSEELKQKLSRFMIRRLKKDVLKHLPEKTYSVIEMNTPPKTKPLIREENKLTEFVGDSAQVKIKLEDTSRIRRELGQSKVPSVVRRLKDMLEETEGKIVVFAYHREVIEAIHDEFGLQAVKLYGGMSLKAKQSSIDSFQKDDSVRLFIGQITSAGVGITLTESSTLVFAEMDYSPANMAQAEDRVHRATQKADSVNIYYLVYRDSLDANIANRLIHKKMTIDSIIE